MLRLATREPEEDEHGTAEPNHVVIAEATELVSQLRAGHGRDLVDHQAAGAAEPVSLVGFDPQAKQRGLGRVGREGANRDGVSGIEAVVLDDNHWAGFADVSTPRGCRPDLAAP